MCADGHRPFDGVFVTFQSFGLFLYCNHEVKWTVSAGEKHLLEVWKESEKKSEKRMIAKESATHTCQWVLKKPLLYGKSLEQKVNFEGFNPRWGIDKFACLKQKGNWLPGSFLPDVPQMKLQSLDLNPAIAHRETRM